MNRTRITTGLLGAVGLLGLATTQAAVIDFEGYAAGTIIDDELAGISVSAKTFGVNTPDVAVIFDTDNITGGDIDLAAPFTNPMDSEQAEFFPGNVLILQEVNPCDEASCETPDDNAAGGRFTFVFDLPVILSSMDFFDIETGEGGSPIEAYDMMVSASDGSSAVPIGTWAVNATGGDNTWGTVDFGEISGVRQLDIVLFGSGAIDNLEYTVIPLPAALWLFGSAIAGLAGLRRRYIK